MTFLKNNKMLRQKKSGDVLLLLDQGSPALPNRETFMNAPLSAAVHPGPSGRVDRDVLGRIVRRVWVDYVSELPQCKPRWVLPFEEIPEWEREVDRRIGEAVEEAVIRGGMLAYVKANSNITGMNSRRVDILELLQVQPAVIGVSGHARSGKSTLASDLGAALRIPFAGFGGEVRRIAAERGISLPPESERERLMALGEELVEQDIEGFCQRVLDSAGWSPGASVIIEGVRHKGVAETLSRLVAPTPFVLVLVDTPAEVREKRLEAEGRDPSARVAMDAHSTEREVAGGLREIADAIVYGMWPSDKRVEPVISILRDRLNSAGR